MARNKEIAIVILDKGPKMALCARHVGKATQKFLVSKMINKPAHEVSLYFYGTNGTQNALHQEFAAQGDDLQYLNITEAEPMACPTANYLSKLDSMTSEEGSSDFMDALTVATDAVYKVTNSRPELEKASVSKRIILVSNFLDPGKGDEEGSGFADEIAEKLESAGVKLDVMSVDNPGHESKDDQAIKKSNLQAIDGILSQLHSKRRSLRTTAEILGAFPVKEYSPTAYYSGPISIAGIIHLKVKAVKKTSQEKLPTFSKYSDVASGGDAAHGIAYDRTFKRADGDDDEIFGPEDMGKAYKYGSQIVPMAREQELALKYAPEKSFQVLGVVKQGSVPRHLFTQDTWAVTAEKGDEASVTAISALAQALRQNKLALLARFLPRNNGEITIGIMTPFNAEDDYPESFIMNCLPYEADVRLANFTTFSKKPDLLPKKQQLAVMDKLIDALALGSGAEEGRTPEKTTNPQLHRFAEAMAHQAKNPGDPITPGDDIVDLILEPDVANKPEKLAAIDALSSNFVIIEKKKKEKKKKDGEKGSETNKANEQNRPDALEEFDKQLEGEGAAAAFAKLGSIIMDMMERKDRKVVQHLLRIRGAAIKLKQPSHFNDLFHNLTEEYKTKIAHKELWEEIINEKIHLITEAEN